MENNCVVSSNGGELQLPVGFRFRPTDQELILYYLKPKVQSLPLPVPAAFIPQIHGIFQSHPSHLPGDATQRRYFFCKINRDYSKTCRSRINYISESSGYWKEVGKEKAISVNVAPRTSFVVGTKKSFVLYQEKQKTSWIMHEYQLLPSQFLAASTTEFENWVAYRVYQRKRKARAKNMRESTEKMNAGEGVGVTELMSIDCSIEVGSPPLPSPLCSSSDDEIFP